MAAATPGKVERPRLEADLVRDWRFEELVRSGYAIADAAELAFRTDVDLHFAISLVRRGCPSATAARIAL